MEIDFVGCSAPYREAIEARLTERGLFEADGPTLVVIAVRDDDAERLQAAVDSDAVVVAVIDRLAPEAYIDALTSGADGVVFVDTSSAITADVIEAALHGEVVLPAQAARAMAGQARRLRPPTTLSDSDRSLLRAIAAGRTIVDLAQEQFYSERTVRRHLQSLYLKLGVQTRAEAIAAATRMGLVD